MTEEITTPAGGSLCFPKSERLHHRTLVTDLFAKGVSVYAYPLRMIYRVFDDDALVASFHGARPCGIDCMQMMVTVPKKKVRGAVKRVLLRRRIKEAYRLNRLSLRDKVAEEHRRVSAAFIFVGNEISSYSTIEKKMVRLLEQLESKLGGCEA